MSAPPVNLTNTRTSREKNSFFLKKKKHFKWIKCLSDTKMNPTIENSLSFFFSNKMQTSTIPFVRRPLPKYEKSTYCSMPARFDANAPRNNVIVKNSSSYCIYNELPKKWISKLKFPFLPLFEWKKRKKKNASGGQSDGQQLLIQPMALLLQFNSNFVRPVSKLYANHMQIPPKRPYEGEERGKKIPSGFEQFSSFPKIIPFISCKFMQISSPPPKKNQLSAELWLFRLLSPFSPQSPHSAHFAK